MAHLVRQFIDRVLPIEAKRAILLSIQRSLVILGSAELVDTRRCSLRDELHLLDRLLHLPVGALQFELVHVVVLPLRARLRDADHRPGLLVAIEMLHRHRGLQLCEQLVDLLRFVVAFGANRGRSDQLAIDELLGLELVHSDVL